MSTQKQKEERKPVHCPYCDSELMAAESPFCQACKVTVFYCPKCRQPLSRENMVCPHCGAKIQG